MPRFRPACLLFICFIIFPCFLAFGQQLSKDDPRWLEQDWLTPVSSPDEALTKKLTFVTIATNNLDSIRLFYVDGLGLTLEGPLAVSPRVLKKWKLLWQIPNYLNYLVYRMHRSTVAGEIEIRVIVFEEQQSTVHASYDPLEVGPLSIGFPNLNQISLDEKIRKMGFTTMAPLEEGKIPRPDGTLYRIYESIFNGPDFVHAVGITRKDGMKQMAPVDSLTELGGPGYSAQVVHNSKEVLPFYLDVLGMELRSDRNWKSSPGSALGIPEGIPFRFSIVYPQGARTGQLLFLDFEDDREKKAANGFVLPHKGIVMWTFQTRNLEEVYRRAQKAGAKVLHRPINMNRPDLGKIRVLMLIDPNGLPVEVYENRI